MNEVEKEIELEEEMSEEKFNTDYWKSHIEYKVDELMDDLWLYFQILLSSQLEQYIHTNHNKFSSSESSVEVP